ncbi:MAG: hypothetical protein AAB956_03975, partial [Patescibacteria group bacterium]
MAATYYYFLLALSLLTLYGAAVYRFYQLNNAGVWLTVALTAVTFIVLKKVNKVKESEGNITGQQRLINQYKNTLPRGFALRRLLATGYW